MSVLTCLPESRRHLPDGVQVVRGAGAGLHRTQLHECLIYARLFDHLHRLKAAEDQFLKWVVLFEKTYTGNAGADVISRTEEWRSAHPFSSLIIARETAR